MPETSEAVDRVYQQRRKVFARLRERCAARSGWLTHARLLAFIAAALALVSLFEPGAVTDPLRLGVTLLLILLFAALIAYQRELNRRRRWYDSLAQLNDEARARRARDWAALAHQDDGPSADPEHRFAADLDLFGPASLSSLLGTVGTTPGRRTLRAWLQVPASRENIRERQAAVAELAPLIDLRQELTVRGRLMPETAAAATDRFLAWAESEPWLLKRPLVLWAARLLPLIALTLIALNLAGAVSYLAWAIALAVNLAFAFTVGRPALEIFAWVFARESAFQGYADTLRRLVVTEFHGPLLRRLQAELRAGGGPTAHRQMERLHRLAGLAELRYSMLYLPIQALTLWDFHVLWRLERWQLTAGRRARAWLSALGELDALAGLAGLRYDNPDWAFPEIVNAGPPLLEARELGHPLLADSLRVGNDVRVGPPGTFLLVTGSNMSGKSTLLRAIGTNVVLARAGGPVCAQSMRLPPLGLETSMRVQDSLQQGLSHFMAELQRLKEVVAAAQGAGSTTGMLLYLLDDIFQGTNTAERQIAARKVIAHLVAANAIGGVTSHDLQLADTEELSAACVPVHFSERVAQGPRGPEITFDYKLRPGFATSKNALKLLALVGLDTEKQRASGAEAQEAHDTADPTAS